MEKLSPKGQRYGRLVVVRELLRDAGLPRRPVECRCDCGKITVTSLYSLRSGNTRSCGCLHSEAAAANGRTPVRLAWLAKHNRSAENLAHLAEIRESPKRIRASHRYAGSARNLKHMRELGRLPQTLKWSRSPENAKQLREALAAWRETSDGQADRQRFLEWTRSPENRLRMRELRRSRRGSDNELVAVDDPDWCKRHGSSFFDHTSRQQRQRCYREWADRMINCQG